MRLPNAGMPLEMGSRMPYVTPETRNQIVATYRQQLTSSGWDAIPISVLQDPIDVPFAQKANVRYASEQSSAQ